MAMNLSMTNLFQFLSYISPFLLAFTFILIGFMNGQPIQPIIYLGVLSLTMGLVVGLLKLNNEGAIPTQGALCNMWNIMPDAYNRPSMSTYFIVFTFAYIMMPMIMANNINYYLMTFILLIFAGDTISKYVMNKCISTSGLVVAFITAAILGTGAGFGIYSINPELTFFSDVKSNRVSCGKKSGKEFVCSVYRNGQLIKNL
jgi:hypothetical protein